MNCRRRAVPIHDKMCKTYCLGKSKASRDVLISEYWIGMHAGIPLILSQIILSIEAPRGNVKVFSGRGEIPHRWYMDNIH